MFSFKENIEMSKKIANLVNKKNGHTYYVGGFVRDLLMNKENKDIDIEIHGITPSELEFILDSLGNRITIGESFGIYGIKGYSIDIAMPRKEKLLGTGHRDFNILVNPFIGTKEAAKRRDFTINAIMQDVLTGEIIDHYQGKEDLKKGIIRHVSNESFKDDSLRVLRAAQFAARFNFKIAPETLDICSTMDLSKLSKERIEIELKKALLQSEKPSIFFDTLRNMNQLDMWFPEIKSLISIKQNPKYHAEGDVWTHTMMVLDECAKYKHKVENPLGFMFSAITHDFGKSICTEITNGEIHSYKHEIEGVNIAKKFLNRITNEANLIRYVLNLTENHMKPNEVLRMNSSIKITNKMFDNTIDPLALIYLAMADNDGKVSNDKYSLNYNFLFDRLSIYKEYMSKPFVNGKDLIEAGLNPSENFSLILEYAHKLRLAGIEKNIALKQVLEYVKNINKQ